MGKKFQDMSQWIAILSKIGSIGNRRAKIFAKFDKEFGKNNWGAAHLFDERIMLPEEALWIYEQAYYKFLELHPEIRVYLTTNALEVIDNDQSNIRSGLDYGSQECQKHHYQDIAVRRALTRLELEDRGTIYDQHNLPELKIFHGNRIIQIRSTSLDEVGKSLSPGIVPFHDQKMIPKIDKNGLWNEFSIEDWYKKSRALMVNPDFFKVSFEFRSSTGLYFSSSPCHFYFGEIKNGCFPSTLIYLKGREAQDIYDSNPSAYVKSRSTEKLPYSQWRADLND